ncbi:hypothetical protein G6011_08680 [Alternaria panax]|uniref:Uncharacterized protein n=1 Tax=Alternaria panax TaxID=48097 RepID=A0AAD4FIV4_9PLEO|nr:hypothetical protein G6011_08680 [Alternaria panax]
MNTLSRGNLLVQSELQSMMHSSAALRDALCAIAALHRFQRIQRSESGVDGLKERRSAMQLYAGSVRCVQAQIGQNKFVDDSSTLWTTFLLGLFELMCDASGTNWLSHFLHRTCAILRLQSPSCLALPDRKSTQKRVFFLSARIFEISRALIYSEPTFLSERAWTSALADLWSGEGAPVWHPKEALFDMLPSFSELSIRVFQYCESEAGHLPEEAQNERAQYLAAEGLLLQRSLHEWWDGSNAWQHASDGLDPELLVAHVYYHAVSIYLSGTYDYHVHWNKPTAPRAPVLARAQIEWHTHEILRLSHGLLATGAAGVLLFFPLRVAGARVRTAWDRNEIMTLFHMVLQRGYAVAGALTADLSELWESQTKA